MCIYIYILYEELHVYPPSIYTERRRRSLSARASLYALLIREEEGLLFYVFAHGNQAGFNYLNVVILTYAKRSNFKRQLPVEEFLSFFSFFHSFCPTRLIFLSFSQFFFSSSSFPFCGGAATPFRPSPESSNIHLYKGYIPPGFDIHIYSLYKQYIYCTVQPAQPSFTLS